MSCLAAGAKNALLMVGAVLAFEVALQVASLVVPVIEDRTRPRIPRIIDDDRLGHRGNPDYPGRDSRGYHNASALQRARIVALGDSQTYGSGVTAEQAWPAVLARRLGSEVYNMGVSGYGAVQNSLNLEEALALRPRLVVFALYFGNDFHDDFAFAFKRGGLAKLIGRDRLAEIERLEAETPIVDEMVRLFRRGRAPRTKNPIVVWFTSHGRVYGLIRNLVKLIERAGENETGDALLSREYARAKAALTGEKRKFASAHDDGVWRTILTAPYRRRGLDEADPRIRAGVEASKHAMVEMSRGVARRGVDFLVLLIPTKESVFLPRVVNRREHVDLERLAAAERRLRAELARHLAEQGIRYLDLLPVLRAASRQPYFGDGDGHPNPHGHELIGDAVAKSLGQNAFTR